MSVLVTGGAGYVGSHIVRYLQERGRNPVAFDTLELGHLSALHGSPFVQADIADAEAVRRAVVQFNVDSVMHLAGYKSPGESMTRPERYFGNNVVKSSVLLEILRQSGVERFVFSSSCAVYGTPDEVPVSEAMPLRPESPYGESKAITEKMLRWYDECLGMRSVSLRYFNAAGAWPDGSIGEDWSATINLIPLLMKAALGKRAPLQLFGSNYPTPDGTAIRDYVHVVDLADAHLKALEYLEAGGASTTVNLGTGVPASVLEVLKAAEDAIGRPVPYEIADPRPGDPIALYADTRRAEDLLGWASQAGLAEILRSAWSWHSSHPDGYPD